MGQSSKGWQCSSREEGVQEKDEQARWGLGVQRLEGLTQEGSRYGQPWEEVTVTEQGARGRLLQGKPGKDALP